jgi:hypothetical protein
LPIVWIESIWLILMQSCCWWKSRVEVCV